MDLPHYLRFVRNLALVSSAGLAACSSGATPADTSVDALVDRDAVSEAGDGARVDAAADASDPDASRDATGNPDTNADVATTDAGGCPATQPVIGEACNTVGVMCSYVPPSDGGIVMGGAFCTCTPNDSGAGGSWRCVFAGGPLSPPDLAATA
jgi:hypothetical protein